VLLLDEPTNALDPEAIVHLRSLIRTVADRGAAVIVSSHQLRELEGTADSLLLLHDGQVRYDGPFASFVGPPALRVRAARKEGNARLAELLRAERIETRVNGDGLHTAGSATDAMARRIFTTAVNADIELVELTHLVPTLEEAFHTAIAGARS
jgi:ABC-2 type transport system ATP-binding protein